MNLDLNAFYNDFNLPTVRRAMASQGYYLFERQLPSSKISEMRAKIDELSSAPDVEINYAGSEHRVWAAEQKDESFSALQALSNWIMPQLYGRPSVSHTVLAIRNRPAPDQAENMQVRWHLDSFRRQLKLFAFLTDVTDESGPLEYIPGTHKPWFKWSAILPLGLYKLKDLKGWKSGIRSWQRIHDRKIEFIGKLGYNPISMNVPAGTLLLVDTSALHRARRCLADERYAVTVYHR